MTILKVDCSFMIPVCVSSHVSGTLSVVDANGVTAVNLSSVTLPFMYPLAGTSLPLRYTPTTNGSLFMYLCNGVDSFTVIARNINGGDGQPLDSNNTRITLKLSCERALCSPGQSLRTSSTGSQRPGDASDSEPPIGPDRSGQGGVCIRCAAGTYNLDANSTCKPCPAGGVCPGGETLLARKDFWFYKPVEAFFKCGAGRCCQNVGWTREVPSLLQRDRQSSRMSLSASLSVASCQQDMCDVTRADPCSGGRAGLLCSGCAQDGHIPWGVTCVHCDKPNYLLLCVACSQYSYSSPQELCPFLFAIVCAQLTV